MYIAWITLFQDLQIEYKAKIESHLVLATPRQKTSKKTEALFSINSSQKTLHCELEQVTQFL